jgi:hypothetical protein
MPRKKSIANGSTRPSAGQVTESKVTDLLAVGGTATVDEIASAAGIGRTSARKHLGVLVTAGKATRTSGGRQGRRRFPDRYRAVEDDARAKESAKPGDSHGERLRPGALDGLVLEFMGQYRDEGPLGPTAVANGLGRSGGAVANCLSRLADRGQVSQVGERPRRYSPLDENR